MKSLKYLSSLLLILIMIWGCADEEDFGSTEFLNSSTPPSNITALFDVTQDNTGLVTITPNADGAISFEVDLGDGSDVVKLKQGESTKHTYAEGTYEVDVKAFNALGKNANVKVPLNVSFKAPSNLDVVIENDAGVSKQVNITVNADDAITFDFYSGEDGVTDPSSGNVGSTISYQYQNPGTYSIRVVVKGAAIETTEYLAEFEVTEILQPITSAPLTPARNDSDVIAIYGTSYTNNLASPNYFPDWGQAGQGSSWAEFDLNGDKMLQYINLSYQGIDFGEQIDASNMEYLHLDVWTAKVTDLEVSAIRPGPDEKPVTVPLTADEWTSIDIPLSDYTDQGLSLADLFQLKLVGTPWAGGTVFVDNIYFWKQPAPASGIEGVWVLAPEEGALKVGPGPNDGSWWQNSAQDLIDRACLFDDQYVFGLDGSFKNILGTDTWVEAWQGGSDSCATPIAPHDGQTPATFTYDAGTNTVVLNGTGAYLGIPKVTDTGELGNPNDAPASITYNNVVLSDNNNTMTVTIDLGWGFWTYKLVRYTSPLVGTWKLAPEEGALKVGPTFNDGSWWQNSAQDLIDRACLFDDEYVFGNDGSFTNVLGSDTWVEAWQGGSDSCDTPVAPHDGMGSFSYIYDESGTVTLTGTGAFLGIPKVTDTGELGAPGDAPASITYQIEFLDSNTIRVWVDLGWGFWTYKMVKS